MNKILLVALLLFSVTVTFGQSSPSYFKASVSYIKRSTDKSFVGPLKNDDIILVNILKSEITILSEACKVYQIQNFSDYTRDGVKYFKFKVTDRNNKQSIFTNYVDEKEISYKMIFEDENGFITMYTMELLKTF